MGRDRLLKLFRAGRVLLDFQALQSKQQGSSRGDLPGREPSGTVALVMGNRQLANLADLCWTIYGTYGILSGEMTRPKARAFEVTEVNA